MKLTGKQSTNVEVRAREFPRPMAGSRIGGEGIHQSDARAYDEWGSQRIKATLQTKNSPFTPMLKGMDKPSPKQSANAKIPIPTERPDPTKPYTKPKVFTRDY